MERSEIRYAVADGHHIAYRVLTGDGGGANDIVMVNGANFPLDSLEGDPLASRMVEGLARLGRLVMFDRRGIGMSDPIVDWDRSLQAQWGEDLAAVIDAAGLDRPAVFSWMFSPVARWFAAQHPERVGRLVLFNPAVVPRADEWDEDAFRAQERSVREGSTPGNDMWPTRWHDPAFREWEEAAGRAGASPSQAARLAEANLSGDWSVTSRISVPTLVIARKPPTMPWGFQDDFFGRAAAEIPGAELVWLPEGDGFPFGVGVDDVLAEVSRFVSGEVDLPDPERFLTAILFTDLVESTRRALTVGDRGWKLLLDRHDEISRTFTRRHGGEVVKSTGDGTLAIFPSTTGAIEAARGILRDLKANDLEVRVGIHAGQVDRRGDDISGLAVNVAARIMATSRADQIVVSETVERVTDDVAFTPLGVRVLKGLDGTWPLYEVP